LQHTVELGSSGLFGGAGFFDDDGIAPALVSGIVETALFLVA